MYITSTGNLLELYVPLQHLNLGILSMLQDCVTVAIAWFAWGGWTASLQVGGHVLRANDLHWPFSKIYVTCSRVHMIGIILLTSDTRLVRALTNPDRGCRKTYEVTMHYSQKHIV